MYSAGLIPFMNKIIGQDRKTYIDNFCLSLKTFLEITTTFLQTVVTDHHATIL